MLAAKISQAHHANKSHDPDPLYVVGKHIMLAMVHRQRDYMQAKDRHVAKFMPCWDGPFKIIEAFSESSTYRLNLPEGAIKYPVFHVSQLQQHHTNNATLFPSHELDCPGLIITSKGATEYFIKQIIDK
jgi:hypothetical protein